MRLTRIHFWMAGALAVGLSTAAGLAAQAFAGTTATPIAQTSPMHPTFALLDADGANVLASGAPVSTSRTCGVCHDTAYIAAHSFHSDLGLSASAPAGEVPNGQPWETSVGLYGSWDPITYRYLSPAGDLRIDLTPIEWLKLNAARIVGGGPAEQAAGVEMDCFLCHLTDPGHVERTAALSAGNFTWANTATLITTGIVSRSGDTYTYNASAFTPEGELQPAFVTVHDPSNANCAQCHGLAHSSPAPLTTAGQDLTQRQTATTGQIVSAQKISQSGMNIADKADLAWAWDLHADRGLECVDCHYALNNPVLVQTSAKSQPDSVIFDPRRLEIGEYLYRPSHEFARGESAQYTVSADLRSTMRRCETCHETTKTHAWLPYTEQHMSEVACETCHIPSLHAPALRSVDWSVITPAAEPILEWRGVEDATGTLQDLITGYEPTLLQRADADGKTTLAPYNLVTAWYWLYDDPAGPRPVRLEDLQSAYLSDGDYHPAIVQALDANGDGLLVDGELRLDTEAKQAMVRGRLEALGLTNPRLAGEVQPYSINHDVVRGEAAIRACDTCHSSDSRIGQSVSLAGSGPTGVTPTLLGSGGLSLNGSITSQDGVVSFTPATEGLYQFGSDHIAWVDWFGVFAVVGVLVGVTIHGGLRYSAALRAKKPHGGPVKRVYMYSVYERFWHWFQTFAILLLVVTGLVVHRPEMFGVAWFEQAVLVHNVLAVLLTVNAALSLFYHLVSGEIQTFIPRPYGFFDQAIVQTRYYLQGIFKHEQHPFEKTPDSKLNPLQQITYFGILNVLLPLQIATGALMLGVQSFPQMETWLGGLPFLAPFHSLVAWTFAAFIIMHVYLTTTGHTPLANIEAMMIGWDEVPDLDVPMPTEPTAQPTSGD
ncbi:MAG: cytochrome b/b6 domain-containing protein [Anaerolineales bacterium]|nr:cytochrome b/b6 domain-containing protein [Anaerolineales bacterium]